MNRRKRINKYTNFIAHLVAKKKSLNILVANMQPRLANCIGRFQTEIIQENAQQFILKYNSGFDYS